MELDQYSPELDEVYEDDEIGKPRLWLGLSVGVFVGIVLGVLSANSIENAFFWIKLGIIVAFISWSLVCLGSLIFRIVNRNLFRMRFAPRLLRVIGLVLLVSGLSYLLGLIFNFKGAGVILTLLPIVFLISVFWTKPQGQAYSLTSILIFGSGIFLISASYLLYGQVAYLISSVGWIYVGMQWGDRALMIGSAISGTAVAMHILSSHPIS